MRSTILGSLALLLGAAPALLAQEAEPRRGLLDPHVGLMFWTLVIFVILWAVLSRFAFRPITAAVEARERQLQEAIEAARRDREEAARVLAEHRSQMEATRADAQRIIAEAHQAGERVRAQMLEEARQQQQAILDRARTEIEGERDRAIAELRREAVDLAILGASKVIERNLDDQTNRGLVERYLSTVDAGRIRHA